eukprot:4551521-Pleurochrysis_carterae.AAC.1
MGMPPARAREADEMPAMRKARGAIDDDDDVGGEARSTWDTKHVDRLDALLVSNAMRLCGHVACMHTRDRDMWATYWRRWASQESSASSASLSAPTAGSDKQQTQRTCMCRVLAEIDGEQDAGDWVERELQHVSGVCDSLLEK